MIEENKVYDELYLPNSYHTYSYPDVWDKENRGLMKRDALINSIKTNIVGSDISPYNLINQTLYQSLMGKHKVLLGEIPETLYRQIIANSLTLDELKDIFKFVADCLEKMDNPISFREAAYDFLPHVFQAPKDLYLTAILKEAFQACVSINAFVGSHHINPIRSYWIPPPNGINFSEATRIPDRVGNETEEDLIEKHALLDSLLEKRPWGKKYIHNPFPYLTDDITSLNQAQIDNYIKCFRFYHKKYETFKTKLDTDKLIPSYKNRIVDIIENKPEREGLGLFEKRENEFKMLVDGFSKEKASDFSLKQLGLKNDGQYLKLQDK